MILAIILPNRAFVSILKDEPCFMDVVGCNLESAFVVKSLQFEDAGDELGVQMQFCGNHKLSILNLGDELYIFNEIPEKLIEAYKLVFAPVKGQDGC